MLLNIILKIKYFFRLIVKQILEDHFYLILPLITILIRLIIFVFIPHIYEDAFITFRYAENLAEGYGFVYNIGEKVQGTTTPLFTILLAILKIVGISCVKGALLINLISEGITSLIIYVMLKRFSSGNIAFILSLLYSLSPSNISWSISGMETAFYTMALAVAFFSLFKEKYYQSLIWGAIACLIRIDGVGAFGILFIFTIIFNKKFDFKIFVLPFLIILLWELFSFLYFGTLLPNSITAKLALYSEHSTGYTGNLIIVLRKFFIKSKFLSSAITLFFLHGIIVSIRKNKKYIPPVLWFFSYYVALIISKTHIHGWYFIPPLFVYLMYFGFSILYISERLKKFINIKVMIIALWACLVLVSGFPIYKKALQLKSEYLYEQNVRILIGKYLKNQTLPDAKIYLEPIGVIGYFSQRYIYDDAGLVSPELIKFSKKGDDIPTRYEKIEYSKPDYLVLRNKYLHGFYEKTPIQHDFKKVKTIDYQLFGKDEGLTIFKSNQANNLSDKATNL